MSSPTSPYRRTCGVIRTRGKSLIRGRGGGRGAAAPPPVELLALLLALLVLLLALFVLALALLVLALLAAGLALLLLLLLFLVLWLAIFLFLLWARGDAPLINPQGRRPFLCRRPDERRRQTIRSGCVWVPAGGASTSW
jgi:hypothetical protein